ncbi:mitochondrial respiratory chain complex II assembly [Mactra antiquata]
MVRHSKIQKQVLNLYREFLRVAKARPGLSEYVRSEFKKQAAIPKTNTLQIEQAYRRGMRQLDMLKRQDVKSVGVFTKDNKE